MGEDDQSVGHPAIGKVAATAPVQRDRLTYLDNLRTSLTVLVICHHVNAAYGSPGGWMYIVHEPGGVITEILTTMFAGVTQAFFMSSFFLIAAFFTAPSYDLKGPWPFMRRRLARLGIPLIFYYYVLSLVLLFMVRCFQGRIEEGFIEFFAANFLRRTSPGPLWFTFSLLVFESIYLIFRLTTQFFGRTPRRYPLPSDRQVLLFIIGIGVFTFLFRQWQPLTHGVYHLRLGYFPLYVCAFMFGVMARRSDWFANLSVAQANRWFYVSLAAIALMPVVMALNEMQGGDPYTFWGGLTWQCYAYAAWEPILFVGINMKLIVLFRDRFNASTPFTRRMAKSSYTAYILHAFFIAAPTYLFTFFSLGRIPEIILMWPVAVIPCFLFADAIRRLPLLKRIL